MAMFKAPLKAETKLPGDWSIREDTLERTWTCSRCGFVVTIQRLDDPHDVHKQIFAHMFDCHDRRKVAEDFPDITTLGQE